MPVSRCMPMKKQAPMPFSDIHCDPSQEAIDCNVCQNLADVALTWRRAILGLLVNNELTRYYTDLYRQR